MSSHQGRSGPITRTCPPEHGRSRELLFSVTRKDLIIDTFTAGGPGGQHQNTSNTAVRIRHPESGASGECREFRSQHQNKRTALHRMVASKKFEIWKMKKVWGHPGSPERQVESDMDPRNLLIMAREGGKWKIID